MSYPHNETPLCHQHGCPDHGRRETEEWEVPPGERIVIMGTMRSTGVYGWSTLDEDGTPPLTTCTIQLDHQFTHHICPDHDIILHQPELPQ